MEFSYTEEQKILEDTVKKFAKNEILPVCSEFENDSEGKLSEEIFEKAAKAGILGTVVPKEYGGGSGRGLEANIVLENLAYGDVGIACAIGASWWAQTAILMRASQGIREAWFPKLASREEAHLCCMAATEPSGGTDVEDPEMGG